MNYRQNDHFSRDIIHGDVSSAELGNSFFRAQSLSLSLVQFLFLSFLSVRSIDIVPRKFLDRSKRREKKRKKEKNEQTSGIALIVERKSRRFAPDVESLSSPCRKIYESEDPRKLRRSRDGLSNRTSILERATSYPSCLRLTRFRWLLKARTVDG